MILFHPGNPGSCWLSILVSSLKSFFHSTHRDIRLGKFVFIRSLKVCFLRESENKFFLSWWEPWKMWTYQWQKKVSEKNMWILCEEFVMWNFCHSRIIDKLLRETVKLCRTKNEILARTQFIFSGFRKWIWNLSDSLSLHTNLWTWTFLNS